MRILSDSERVCRCNTCNKSFIYERLDICNYYSNNPFVICPNCNDINYIDIDQKDKIEPGSIIEMINPAPLYRNLHFLVLKIHNNFATCICNNNNFELYDFDLRRCEYKVYNKCIDFDKIEELLSDKDNNIKDNISPCIKNKCDNPEHCLGCEEYDEWREK